LIDPSAINANANPVGLNAELGVRLVAVLEHALLLQPAVRVPQANLHGTVRISIGIDVWQPFFHVRWHGGLEV
jgi:hypothetical protein